MNLAFFARCPKKRLIETKIGLNVFLCTISKESLTLLSMVIVNYRYDTNMQNVVVNQFKIRCPHLNMQAMALKTKLVRNTHC
jgi:hypothetical protein